MFNKDVSHKNLKGLRIFGLIGHVELLIIEIVRLVHAMFSQNLGPKRHINI